MAIKCEKYKNICVIGFKGDLAGDISKEIRHAVEQEISQHNVVSFVVDFEQADFVDSEGLETLLWAKRRCDEMFGQFKIANLDENCTKIFEITRLEHQFESHPDLASALKTMQ